MAKSEVKADDNNEEEVPAAGKKREDWKKLKELEEARKAGTAPAMKDEEGKDINPHIPQYIMQAPWYFGAAQPTLKHQREPTEWKKEYTGMDVWFKKGVKEGPTATKYRDGACENCGAMTHKKKDCLERPRARGARYTGQDIAPDEYVQPDLEFDYEGKRDRWNGYDSTTYKHVVDGFQALEDARRLQKAQKIEKALLDGSVDESVANEINAEDNDDEDKYADDMAMPGQKFETKQRITVRNLRIREDTAKYLLNLDPNSAHYDPKTRSMRENPFAGQGSASSDLPFAGDNFVRWSGDAQEMSKRQLFAWEAYEKGTDVHVQADPTKLELLSREFNKRKEAHVTTKKESILGKYGGEEHLDALPKQLLLAQTEEYVEYSRHGTLLKGQEKAAMKSRYEEDVYINNHVSVWGSYWKDGRWGFKCCHSFIRESYCIGQAGKLAQQAALDEKSDDEEAKETGQEVTSITTWVTDPSQAKSLLQQHLEKLHAEEKQQKKRKKRKQKHRKKKKKHSKKSSSSSEDDDDDSDSDADNKDKKLSKAMKKEDLRLKEVEQMLAMDERKRPYNVRYEDKPLTEEEIEAYQRKRFRDEDPMANFTNT